MDPTGEVVGGKLPVEHVAGLLAEAGRLHRHAARLFDESNVQQAINELNGARLLVEDAASYALPSGMKLSTAALASSIKLQLKRLGC